MHRRGHQSHVINASHSQPLPCSQTQPLMCWGGSLLCCAVLCCAVRVRGSTLLWRVPVSEDGELGSPQRRFFLHANRHSHMHVTGETHNTHTHTGHDTTRHDRGGAAHTGTCNHCLQGLMQGTLQGISYWVVPHKKDKEACVNMYTHTANADLLPQGCLPTTITSSPGAAGECVAAVTTDLYCVVFLLLLCSPRC
jgi:hypothetical protein